MGKKKLSPRELSVLRLAGRRLSNDQIAAELKVSSRTVANHLQHAFDKLGVRDRRSAWLMVIRDPEYGISMGEPPDLGIAGDAPQIAGAEQVRASGLERAYAALGSWRRPKRIGGSLLPIIVVWWVLAMLVITIGLGIYTSLIGVGQLAAQRHYNSTQDR